MKLLVPSLLAFVALTGCQTFEQMSEEQKAALVQKKGEECQTIGYKPGTDAFTQCVHLAILKSDQNATNRRVAMGNALSETGSDISARSRQQATSVNRPLNCNSRRSVDGSVNTSCY